MLTSTDEKPREEQKEIVVRVLKNVERPGVESLVKWLTEESDFFEAPASTVFHLAVPGGLADHSLNVYNLLWDKVLSFGLKISEESIILCGLMHDLCKTGLYFIEEEEPSKPQLNYLQSLAGNNYRGHMAEGLTKRYAGDLIGWYKAKGKENGVDQPTKTPGYVTRDTFPLGHGEKSVALLQEHIKLTQEEMLAIRWHLASYDASIHFDYPNGYAYRAAVKMSPLVTLLFTADYEASNILEA